MAVYQVASTADYNTLMGVGITAADTVEFLDAGTFADIHIGDDGAVTHAAVPVGATFVAQTSGVSTLSRLIINAGGVSVQGLKVQVNHDYFTSTLYSTGAWSPALPTADWHLVELNNISDWLGLELIDLDIRGGFYNGGTYDDFIVTSPAAEAAYAACIGDLANGIYDGTPGPIPGTEADPEWYDDGINLFTYVPGGIGPGIGGGVESDGDLLIRGCRLRDLGNGVSLRLAGGVSQNLRIQRNRFQRIYVDGVHLSFSDPYAGLAGLEMTGNEFEDVTFCQSQDNNNPHGEPLQITHGLSALGKLRGLHLAGNVAWERDNFRGAPQRFLLSDHDSGYPYIRPRIHDNLLLSRRSEKGIQLSADNPPTGAVWGYIYRNAPLVIPGQHTVIGNALYPNPVTGVPMDPGATAALITVDADSTSYPDALNYVGLNIAEGISSTAGVVNPHPNIITGQGTAAGDYSEGYPTPVAWGGNASLDDVIGKYKAKAGYEEYGPVRPADDGDSFLDRWSQDVKPWGELRAAVGIPDTLRQVAGAADVESNWGFAHTFGPRLLTVPAGVEYRTCPEDDGYPDTGSASAWTGTAGNIDDVFIQLRADVTGVPGLADSHTYSIGDDQFIWRLGADSGVSWPRAAFAGDAIVRKNASTSYTAADSRYLLFMLVFKTAALSGVIVGANPSGTGRFTATMQATSKTRISMGDQSPAIVWQSDPNVLFNDGNEHTIIAAIDIDAATSAAGLQLYVDGVQDATAALQWTGPGKTFDFDAARAPQIGGSATTANWTGEISCFALWPGVTVDLSDPDILDKFDPAYIGPAGEAITGAAAPFFLPGVAANYDSGDANLGSDATTWTKVGGGGTITAGNAAVWPPVLQLYASPVNAGPYIVGEPLDILVQAAGYPKGGMDVVGITDNGTIADDTQTLVLGSDGLTYTVTPDTIGALEFDHTNTGGYLNGPTLVLDIVADPGGGASSAHHGSMSLGLVLAL